MHHVCHMRSQSQLRNDEYIIRRQMVKILKYDNPDHTIKLKIRHIQVLGKSTGQINNTSYEWYIGS